MVLYVNHNSILGKHLVQSLNPLPAVHGCPGAILRLLQKPDSFYPIDDALLKRIHELQTSPLAEDETSACSAIKGYR